MIRLELDGIPPTLNEWARTHWTKQREKKNEWEWTVLAAALKAKTGRPGYQEARIHITYHFKQKRRRDTDNYAPKFLLDALVKAGIIEDDRADRVNVTWAFITGTGVRQTVIEIKEGFE